MWDLSELIATNGIMFWRLLAGRKPSDASQVRRSHSYGLRKPREAGIYTQKFSDQIPNQQVRTEGKKAKRVTGSRAHEIAPVSE